MTPNSLFNIILKIIGIFFIKDILVAIPQLFSLSVFLSEPNTSGAFWSFIAFMVSLIIYCVASYLLIFKTQSIIRILRLDKGFDQENFPLTVHRSTVLSIATVVIGGLLLAEEIPNFCRQLYTYFVEKRVSFSYTVLSAAKIVIGLLLIWNRRQIVNFVELRRKK